MLYQKKSLSSTAKHKHLDPKCSGVVGLVSDMTKKNIFFRKVKKLRFCIGQKKNACRKKTTRLVRVGTVIARPGWMERVS